MAYLTLKDKISTLIQSQLPEFIGVNNDTFVSFLKAYYEFLEQSGYPQELLSNARSYRDIDRTTSEFIEYFKKEYCNDIPRDAVVDDTLLVKKIRQLYASKGSQTSYDLLFRILFNKSIDFLYPGTKILYTSDGRWVQDVSVFIQTITGNPNTIVGASVNVIDSLGVINNVLIKNKQDTLQTEGGVTQTSTAIFQYLIDNSNDVPIQVGNYIQYGSFRGIVVPTTVSVDVIVPGRKFKVGQVYSIQTLDGRGSVLKIDEVDSNGGIVRAKFIKFGIGYDIEFLASFGSTTSVVLPGQVSFGTETISIGDNVPNLVDQMVLNRYTYALDGGNLYFEPSFVGTILRTALSSTSDTTSQPEDEATIFVRIGAKAKYQGYFKTNKGFLSDDIYLQNRDYYQPYSYVIKIDEQLVKFKKAVLDILHPAGNKLFGDYIINNDVKMNVRAFLSSKEIISSVYIGSVPYLSFVEFTADYTSDTDTYQGSYQGTALYEGYILYSSPANYELLTNYDGIDLYQTLDTYASLKNYDTLPNYVGFFPYVGYTEYTLPANYGGFLAYAGYNLYASTKNYNLQQDYLGYGSYFGVGTFASATYEGYSDFIGQLLYAGSDNYTSYVTYTSYSSYSSPANFIGAANYQGFAGYLGYGQYTAFNNYTTTETYTSFQTFQGYSDYIGARNYAGTLTYVGKVDYATAANYTSFVAYTNYQTFSTFATYDRDASYSRYLDFAGFVDYTGIALYSITTDYITALNYASLLGYDGPVTYPGTVNFEGANYASYLTYLGPEDFEGATYDTDVPFTGKGQNYFGSYTATFTQVDAISYLLPVSYQGTYENDAIPYTNYMTYFGYATYTTLGNYLIAQYEGLTAYTGDATYAGFTGYIGTFELFSQSLNQTADTGNVFNTSVVTTGIKNLTMSGWAVRDGTDGGLTNLAEFLQNDTSNTYSVYAQYDSNNNLNLGWYSNVSGSVTSRSFSLPTTPLQSFWYYWVLQTDQSNNTYSLKVTPNYGTTWYTQSNSIPTGQVFQPGEYQLMGNRYLPQYNFRGKVAYVKVWDAVLNETELAAESLSAFPVRLANLHSAFADDPTVDVSNNNRAWTIQGSTSLSTDVPFTAEYETVSGSVDYSANNTAGTFVAQAEANITQLGITDYPYSMFAWIYPYSNADASTAPTGDAQFGIVVLDDKSTNTNFQRMSLGNSDVNIEIERGSVVLGRARFNGTAKAAISNTIIQLNTWSAVGITMANVAPFPTIKVYVHGSNANTYVFGGPDLNIGFSNQLDELLIGRDSSSLQDVRRNFDGKIARAAIWDAVLSSEDMVSLTNGESPLNVKSANLRAYWPGANINIGGNDYLIELVNGNNALLSNGAVHVNVDPLETGEPVDFLGDGITYHADFLTFANFVDYLRPQTYTSAELYESVVDTYELINNYTVTDLYDAELIFGGFVAYANYASFNTIGNFSGFDTYAGQAIYDTVNTYSSYADYTGFITYQTETLYEVAANYSGFGSFAGFTLYTRQDTYTAVNTYQGYALYDRDTAYSALTPFVSYLTYAGYQNYSTIVAYTTFTDYTGYDTYSGLEDYTLAADFAGFATYAASKDYESEQGYTTFDSYAGFDSFVSYSIYTEGDIYTLDENFVGFLEYSTVIDYDTEEQYESTPGEYVLTQDYTTGYAYPGADYTGYATYVTQYVLI